MDESKKVGELFHFTRLDKIGSSFHPTDTLPNLPQRNKAPIQTKI